MSKWERVSKMRFKHENVHLVPYPYICTMYLELNSFQQNMSCGKSLWLYLDTFWKHIWSMSCFSLSLHLLYLWTGGSKLRALWLYRGFEIQRNNIFSLSCVPFLKCPESCFAFSTTADYSAGIFMKQCPVAPSLPPLMSVDRLEPAHVWKACFPSLCLTTFVNIELHTLCFCFPEEGMHLFF